MVFVFDLWECVKPISYSVSSVSSVSSVFSVQFNQFSKKTQNLKISTFIMYYMIIKLFFLQKHVFFTTNIKKIFAFLVIFARFS